MTGSMRAGTAFVALRAIAYAGVFVLLWVWLVRWADQGGTRRAAPVSWWMTGSGAALMAIGAALALASIAVFVVRGQGTPAPFDAPRKFVATGPYRRVRNPMYVGAFLLLVGYALYAGSVGVLLVAFAMLAAAHLFVLLYEEPTLRARFGSSYETYLSRTPRWLPRLRDRDR